MTTVFIDTNIIINESFLRSANARAFFKACVFIGINVAIPEIVIDEALGNFPKSLAERLKSYRKSYKELAKLIDLDETKVSAEKAVAEYQGWLNGFLTDHGVHLIAYPDITPKELVAKSYENRKPFKHHYYSEGFKDGDIYISDPDWNDHVMAVSTTVETAFELKLFYSPEKKEVAGYALTLPQEIEDEWYK
ncbi:MAG TPA: PIN domain-containing protein [Rhizomicrobium sp.]|jgi:predicted nucleic acid-binding protein